MMLILWVIGGVIALILDTIVPSAGHQYAQLLTASLGLALGVVVFWRSGGPRVTAAGLYCLGMSIYVGFAGIWWALQGPVTDGVYIATNVGYWTMVILYFVFWQRVPYQGRLQVRAPAVTSWGLRAGLVVCVGGLGLAVAGIGNFVQLAVGALAFPMIALIMRLNGDRQRILVPAITVGLVLALFWIFVFSGGGRLNLVVLALVGVVVISMCVERRLLKLLLLASAAPLVVALGWIETVTSRANTVAQGLASVVNPLSYFGELVVGHNRGIYELGGGEALTATALFWVPRAFWPDKPDGFGAVLSDLLRPGLRETNNSLAALAFGEWYYDFGWIGVAAMLVVVGFGIRWLDIVGSRIVYIDSNRDFLRLVVVAILVAGMPTFAWVGTFTYVARTVQQLIPVLVLALPWASRRKKPNNDKARVGNR